MTRALFTLQPAPHSPAGTVRLRLAVGGHAGYAPKGQDIVCAAASILAEALTDALQQEAETPGTPTLRLRSTRQDGLVILSADCPPQRYARVRGLFDTALAGYRLLAQYYPDHVALRTAEEAESCRNDGGLYNE